MSKKMLIDAAHPEEVRVAVVAQKKIEDFDFESAARKPLRGNIFLARVTRVEPSLQAAFVDYGGNRHGFLAFSEIHPDYYQIPVSDRNLLQEAEQEVAELAAELELAQRGDDEDEDEDGEDRSEPDSDADDDQPDADARLDSGDESAADASTEEENGEDSAEDGDDEIRAEAADDNVDDADDDDQPAERRDVEEEEEEETDGEDEDADEADTSDEKPDSDAEKSEDASPAELDASAEDSDDEDGDASDDGENDDAEIVSEAAGDDSDAENDNDADGDEDDADDDGKASAAKSARAARNELLERYKDAKRKRANLLRNYKIQEVIKRRQILLIQVVKEERGNKGAALTTYMSLAGRYCVLMPNTARGGGISRKIANGSDRRRLRRVVDSLEVPRGMGLIIRTAGAKRTKTEIKRDYDYLLRLWENIRSLTLKSIAPCLIYEEASLIKRAIRDLYDKDISKVYVEGEDGYREAKDFMKMLMPSHAKNVQPYKDRAPIFLKHGVETQLDGMYQPSVRLKSGGYIVIHQTEALVAIDVNSGRATRERNIEQTALRTNIEAAEEAARQFRLRDLAGLIVIDFIDMEEPRNNRKVERALKDAMKADRARVQVGRISSFGLLELSRQRRRSGIVDGTTQSCPTCAGAGVIRSQDMAAFRILRGVEGEAIAGRVGKIAVRTSVDVALHVLNHHREWINRIENANAVSVEIIADPDKHGDDYELETSGAPRERSKDQQVIRADQTEPIETDDETDEDTQEVRDVSDAGDKPKKRKRRRRSRRDRDEAETRADDTETKDGDDREGAKADAEDESEEAPKKRRRRGRRGGRRNRKDPARVETTEQADADSDAPSEPAPEKSEVKETGADDIAAQDSANDDADRETGADVSAEKDDSITDQPLVAADMAQDSDDEQPEIATEQTAEPAAAESVDDEEAPAATKKKRVRGGWWRRSAS